MVVNPRQVRDFARPGKLAKTDGHRRPVTSRASASRRRNPGPHLPGPHTRSMLVAGRTAWARPPPGPSKPASRRTWPGGAGAGRLGPEPAAVRESGLAKEDLLRSVPGVAARPHPAGLPAGWARWTGARSEGWLPSTGTVAPGGGAPGYARPGWQPPAAATGLLAAGKPKKLALTACMRKLLVILNSMLKHGSSWCDPSPQVAGHSS